MIMTGLAFSLFLYEENNIVNKEHPLSYQIKKGENISLGIKISSSIMKRYFIWNLSFISIMNDIILEQGLI